jgi:hypothetical protein
VTWGWINKISTTTSSTVAKEPNWDAQDNNGGQGVSQMPPPNLGDHNLDEDPKDDDDESSLLPSSSNDSIIARDVLWPKMKIPLTWE